MRLDAQMLTHYDQKTSAHHEDHEEHEGSEFESLFSVSFVPFVVKPFLRTLRLCIPSTLLKTCFAGDFPSSRRKL